MRRFRIGLLSACSLTLLVWAAQGQQQQDDVKDIIRKAIEVHGGAEKLAKFKASTAKFKGKLEIMGMNLEISGDQIVMFPDKLRVVTTININGQQINSTQVFDGKQFWVSAGGNTMELNDEKLITDIKEGMAAERAGGLVGLLGKEGYELSIIGDAKVKDKDAVGVRVTKKGTRDVSLFFDKKTHLLVKTEMRTTPPGGAQEVTQEKYFFDFYDVMGLKSPRRVLVEHDGKAYIDIEITEASALESVDESNFKMP